MLFEALSTYCLIDIWLAIYFGLGDLITSSSLQHERMIRGYHLPTTWAGEGEGREDGKMCGLENMFGNF